MHFVNLQRFYKQTIYEQTNNLQNDLRTNKQFTKQFTKTNNLQNDINV